MISKVQFNSYSLNPYTSNKRNNKRANNTVSFKSETGLLTETITAQTEGLLKKAVSILEEKVAQFMKLLKDFQAEKEADLGISVTPLGFDPPEFTPACLLNKSPINGYKDVAFANDAHKTLGDPEGVFRDYSIDARGHDTFVGPKQIFVKDNQIQTYKKPLDNKTLNEDLQDFMTQLINQHS